MGVELSMKYEKLLNKNYGSIPHLSISKLNQEADKRVTIGQENILTHKTRDKHDIIIVTEKVDGANVGILKKDGDIFGVSRNGLDVRSSTIKQIRLFQDYIDKHRNRYFEMLKEGERKSIVYLMNLLLPLIIWIVVITG